MAQSAESPSRWSCGQRYAVPPTLTAVNAPAGGVVAPWQGSPQQAMVPSIRKPQVRAVPALTDTKTPGGAEACPWVLSPQQAIVPSVFMSHACVAPALTSVNVPEGGLAWPWILPPGRETTGPRRQNLQTCRAAAFATCGSRARHLYRLRTGQTLLLGTIDAPSKRTGTATVRDEGSNTTAVFDLNGDVGVCRAKH